jgi:hypothetical protein
VDPQTRKAERVVLNLQEPFPRAHQNTTKQELHRVAASRKK